jgi:hypothetical protein
MDDSGYGNTKGNDALEEKNVRRLNSIKSSLSFRLGNLLVTSVMRPWKLAILPFTVTVLLWDFGRERLGKRSIGHEQELVSNSSTRNCAILFPTNGVGMGHYARMYALAMAMKRKDPSLEIVFFTTNYVLHPLYAEGITAYHLPNRQKFQGMDARTWNSQCEEMLANVFSVHRPSIFVFDGAYPYRGMLNAIKTRSGVARVWIRRITRKGKDSVPVDSYSHFDRIVVPGDLIEPDMGELAKWPVEEINLTSPLLSVSRSDLHPRGELRSRLGIPSDATVCLVSLGAGEINDIEDLRRFVLEGLLERGIYVIIADSMLKPMRSRFDDDKVRVVQSFPIMRNRNCLDFAITAGGYNSVNECQLLRLPSVIIPNYETSRDDQPGRAAKAAERGGSILVERADRGIIGLALERICDPDVRSSMAERLVMGVSDDGAESLAESLLSN